MKGRKTTEADVEAVLEMLGRGCSIEDICAEVGVTKNTVTRIRCDGWRPKGGPKAVRITRSTSRDFYVDRGGR